MSKDCFDKLFCDQLDSLNEEIERANSHENEIAKCEKQIESIRKQQNEEETNIRIKASYVFSEKVIKLIHDSSVNIGLEDFSVDEYTKRFSKESTTEIEDICFLIELVKRIKNIHEQRNDIQKITCSNKKPHAFLQKLFSALTEGGDNND